MKPSESPTLSTPEPNSCSETELSRLHEVKRYLDKAKDLTAGGPYAQHIHNHIISATIEINRQIKLCEHQEKR